MSHNTKTFLELNEGLRILYVEDSAMVRESTMYLLEEYFDSIDIAEDGEEGLQMYQHYYKTHNNYYDIVITDINMPKMNGIEMLESIYTINKKAHAVVTSAHNEPEYLLQLIHMGISNFILKPMSIENLEKILFPIVESIDDQKSLKHYQEKLEETNLALREKTEEAVAASLQKSQFLANMSHEIRTPLNAITGFITILNEQETDPQKLQHFNIIKHASNSLLQTITDILDISKIESGKLNIEPTNFNPYDDLITIAELFQAKAAEKGVVLNIFYNPNMPKVLYSDIYRIKQILANLLSNAIKFSAEGSNIKCVIWYAKGRLNLRIKDYGIGIEKEQQQYVFETFTQEDSSTEKEYGGTGLGLAISKQLTLLLGGTLSLESKKGKGSVFTLSIGMSIGKDQPEESTSSTLPVDSKPLQGHLLIVEDYEANRMFLSIILENLGLTHEMAHNGLEAVERFKNSTYDLILMDENMPELGGIAATKQILELEKESGVKHTTIISLTANALKGDKERFLDAGMDAYISKPIEPDILQHTIRGFLESHV